MMALPGIPPLSFAASSSAASRQETAFGSGAMSINYGGAAQAQWIAAALAVAGLLWWMRRKG